MQPLGVFDSGVGGLTVVRELFAALPHESMVYFGDTARVPYGNKSPETVIRYSLEIADFLVSLHCKLLVVACNTVSALALGDLRKHVTLPIVDVIEPAIESAARYGRTTHVAVLGTKATIRSGIYQQRLQEALPGVKISAVACPLFVPLVEERLHEHPATAMIVREYLKPLIKERVDMVILGCTHYPLLTEMIREVLGDHVVILDSARACVKKIEAVLSSSQLKAAAGSTVQIRYYVSDDVETFKKFGEHFLGRSIDSVEHLVPLPH